MRVKICCISSIGEARLAVRLGASALGLVAEMPSGPGVIPEALIARIAATVPPPVATFLLTSRRIVEVSPVPVFLAGGLTPTNVGEAIRSVRPFGVDLCTGVRTAGALDENKLLQFMKAVAATTSLTFEVQHALV